MRKGQSEKRAKTTRTLCLAVSGGKLPARSYGGKSPGRETTGTINHPFVSDAAVHCYTAHPLTPGAACLQPVPSLILVAPRHPEWGHRISLPSRHQNTTRGQNELQRSNGPLTQCPSFRIGPGTSADVGLSSRAVCVKNGSRSTVSFLLNGPPSREDTMASATTSTVRDGASHLNKRSLGIIVFSNIAVRMWPGSTRVVRISGVLYLDSQLDIPNRPRGIRDEPVVQFVSKTRMHGDSGGLGGAVVGCRSVAYSPILSNTVNSLIWATAMSPRTLETLTMWPLRSRSRSGRNS